MKIQLEIRENKTTEKGYKQLKSILVYNLGYKKVILEYIPDKVAELLGCSVGKLYTLDVGVYDVGTIYGLNTK